MLRGEGSLSSRRGSRGEEAEHGREQAALPASASLGEKLRVEEGAGQRPSEQTARLGVTGRVACTDTDLQAP